MGNRGTAAKSRPVSETGVPVVGIGASAVGAKALTKLLEKLPPDSGLAIVLIPHPDLEQDGRLSSRLSRATRIPVHQVSRAIKIQPNHIYEAPGNSKPIMSDSTMRLGRTM